MALDAGWRPAKGLTEYFRSLRAAFDDRSIRRGIIVAEGDFIACQTWIEGAFARPFAQSPAGTVEPTGARVVMEPDEHFQVRRRRSTGRGIRQDRQPSLLRQVGAEVA
jgi:hypothetical protein